MSDAWMSYNGSGSLNSGKTNYSATLKGVASSKGSSVKINGLTGILLTGFGALTNIVTLDNIAASPVVTILSTNMSLSTNYPYLSELTTNVVSSNVVVEASSAWYYLPVPPAIRTNYIPNGIKTITASGKIMGQKVSGSGLNPDAYFDE
jgi:hypothetical protein